MPCSSPMPIAQPPRWIRARCAPQASSPSPWHHRLSGHLETTAQGRAFLDITRAAWPCAALDRLDAITNGLVALPVAVAAACAGHGIALAPAVGCYLHALAANLISAGVRLIPLGQSDGQRVLAALEPVVDGHRRARADHAA